MKELNQRAALCWVVLCLTGALWPPEAGAQPSPPRPGGLAAPVSSASPLPRPAGTQVSTLRLPPLPPTWQSPIDYFRKLLAADGPERERLLADKTRMQRQIFLNSLREYEALVPQERELRLRALDLRAYLTPLLRLSPSNRFERIPLIPEHIRPLVERRLELWDQIPPEAQKLVLENERVMRLVVSAERGIPRTELSLTSLTAPQVKQLEGDIARWQELPDTTRERTYEQFQEIFDASEKEQQKTFAPLNEAELKQMQAVLLRFRHLPKIQRDQCLAGFRKFAELTPEERRQFLINAEEWKKLAPEDRQLWRDLVQRFPPLPPGYGGPPRPPSLPKLSPKASVVLSNR